MALILDMPMQDYAEDNVVVDEANGDYTGAISGNGVVPFFTTVEVSVPWPGATLRKAFHFQSVEHQNIYFGILGISPSISLESTATIGFACRRNSSAGNDAILGSSSSGRLFFSGPNTLELRDNNLLTAQRDITGIDTTQRHHYALVGNAGVVSLYVDAVLIGNFDETGMATVSVNAFGHDDDLMYSDADFNGLRLYDTTRTQQQIAADYALVQEVQADTPPRGALRGIFRPTIRSALPGAFGSLYGDD